MMDFFPHPTDPNLVVLRATTRYIGKHSDEDLKAAVLAEREACANLSDEHDDDVGMAISRAIRARGQK